MHILHSTLLSLSIGLALSACEKKAEVKEEITSETKQIPHKREERLLSYASVVKKVAPAVVSIYAFHRANRSSSTSPFMDDPFFKQFFDRLQPEEEREQNALGSGVLVNRDGLILTNYHVIENADIIRVVLSNKQEYVAKLIVADRKTDLAVLQIEGNDFPFLNVSPQEDLEVGDIVLAIGNPFGVGQTVTTGIVSALARSQEGISDYRSFIQTDAAINPGNSGGALVTTDGRLVGINTAIYSKTGGSIGIGFAIPTSLAIPVIKSVENGGNIARPWLGVAVVPVDAEIAHALGLSHPYGALIENVYPDSPAEEAGLKVGDLVTTFDHKEIQDDASLDYQIAISPLGKTVDILIFRKGKEQKIPVVLKAPLGDKSAKVLLIQGQNPLQGASLKTLSPALALELGLNPMQQGVIVTNVSPSGAGARLGIKPGDILETVNKKKVKTQEEAARILEESAPNWILGIRRGDQVLSVKVTG